MTNEKQKGLKSKNQLKIDFPTLPDKVISKNEIVNKTIKNNPVIQLNNNGIRNSEKSNFINFIINNSKSF